MAPLFHPFTHEFCLKEYPGGHQGGKGQKTRHLSQAKGIDNCSAADKGGKHDDRPVQKPCRDQRPRDAADDEEKLRCTAHPEGLGRYQCKVGARKETRKGKGETMSKHSQDRSEQTRSDCRRKHQP